MKYSEDYIESLAKEQMVVDRETIMSEFDNHMMREGYTVSDKSRSSVVLTSRTYSYINSFWVV